MDNDKNILQPNDKVGASNLGVARASLPQTTRALRKFSSQGSFRKEERYLNKI